MTNSKYRCLGCREFKAAPPYKRQGLGGLCSEECLTIVRNRGGVKTAATKSLKSVKARDEVPPSTREAVLLRDSARCRWCGVRTVHLHHINYRSEGVDHSEHNLITLCPHHHDVVHSDKARFKPLLLAVIWHLYITRWSATVPQVERWLARA